MPKQPLQPILERVSAAAWRHAARLGTENSDGEKTRLSEVAKSVNVIAIRFEPLLSSAGIKRTGPTDFEIVLNDEGAADATLEKHCSVSEEILTGLPSPLRFSIAHEIAHALLLKAAGGDERAVVFRDVSAIEASCHILARLILLPTTVLREQIPARIDSLERIREFIRAAGVSPELFLLRLLLPDAALAFKGKEGLLALVDANSSTESCVVTHCVIFGAHSLDRFDRSLSDRGRASVKLGSNEALSKEYSEARYSLVGRTLDVLHKGLSRRIVAGEANFPIDIAWGHNRTGPFEVGAFRLDQRRYLAQLNMRGPLSGSDDSASNWFDGNSGSS